MSATCYGYARSSATFGPFVEEQKAEIRQYYQDHLAGLGLAFPAILVDEGQPGGPEWQRLCAVVRSGDHVIVASLDRAFRSHQEAAATLDEWLVRGVCFHFIRHQIDSTTPIGKMLIGQMALFAELEREMGGRAS